MLVDRGGGGLIAFILHTCMCRGRGQRRAWVKQETMTETGMG